MAQYDWKALMTKWNTELLDSKTLARARETTDDVNRYSNEVLSLGWLGYPGATVDQLAKAEARLGTVLPPDYRDFLAFSNGWRALSHFIPGLWSSDDIEWLTTTDAHLVSVWTEQIDEIARSAGVDPIDELYETKYIRSTLQISEQEYAGTAILLLNPMMITQQGDWEGWFFAHWVPGARVYPSFWELMQAEYKSFRNLEDYEI